MGRPHPPSESRKATPADAADAWRAILHGSPHEAARLAWALDQDSPWLCARPPDDPLGRDAFAILWSRARSSGFDPGWTELLSAILPGSGRANLRLPHGILPAADAASAGEAALPLVQACVLAGANPWKKGADRRSALSAAKASGSRRTQEWLEHAAQAFDRHESDSVKEDLAEGEAWPDDPAPWQSAFAREAALGPSSFDQDCAWIATRRWGAPAAARMWTACSPPATAEGRFAEWLLGCAWSGVPMPSPRDLPGRHPRLFARLLGHEAAAMCGRERAHRHPDLLDGLLAALESCCELAQAPLSEARTSFVDGARRWDSLGSRGGTDHAREAFARLAARRESRDIALAAPEPAGPPPEPRRL